MPPSGPNFHLSYLFERALGIAVELGNGFAGVFVVNHLRKKLGWNSHDVSTGERGILHINDGTHTADDDLCGVPPRIKPLPHIADGQGWIVSFVRDSASEDADVSGARLGCEQRLVERKNGGSVNVNALLR